MKQVLQKIVRWCSVIFMMLLVCILVVSSCSAEGEVTGANLVEQMQKAAEVQLVTQKFIRCMDSRNRTSTSDLAGHQWTFLFSTNATDIFYLEDSAWSKNIAVGAWLEKKVQDKMDDGEIWCGNNDSNIVNVFTETLGITREQLFCNGDEPGIMRLLAKPGTYWSVTPGCSAGFGNSTDYRFTFNGDWESHLEKLYNDYITREQNPYLVAFEDIGEYKDPKIAYFLYLNDFIAFCTNGDKNYETSKPDSSSLYFSPVLGANLSTGKLEERYYSNQHTYKGKTDWGSSFVKDGPHTCSSVISRINGSGDRQSLAPAVSEIIVAFRRGAEIQNCLDKFKENLSLFDSRIKEYEAQQDVAKKLMTHLSNRTSEIQAGRFSGMIYSGENISAYYDLDRYINNALVDIQNSLIQGINGQNIYDSNLLAVLIEAFKDIAANTTVASDHITIESRPDDAVFDEFRSLLEKWQDELNRVEEEIETAKEKLEEKEDEVNEAEKNLDSDNTELWSYSREELTLTCSVLEGWEEEIGGIFTAVPPESDVDWSVVVLPDNDGIFDGNGDGTMGVTATCYNSTSLGWILCSGIELVGGVTKFAYDYIVENFLTVDARYINDPNTVAAWGAFQGFANIIFVILFIIVIFSQITGLGLTNYGVKRALPKLIMVAVLVNISYIICAVAVDLSNILGDSLQSLFETLAAGFGTDKVFNFSHVIGDALSFILTGIAVVTITVAAFNWDLWLPVFGLALIGMAFSVMFFFIILAVRQAGVIILLVIAPIAIVCYALPNTKGIFDRWKKMFVSLLVVYPICGALMGGGTFASTLLLVASGDSSGFFFNLVAMLIKIIPFFFIPYLVRSSMAAIGGIGNRISNFGRGLSKSTTGALRRSDGFRRLQAKMQDSAMKGGERFSKTRLGRLGASYRSSSLPGAEARRRAYDRKKARRTRAVTAQMDADLRDELTAKRGTEVAKANANQALREDYSRAYQRDIDFMTDAETQKKELVKALDAVENNAEDPNNIARLRAIQDIMSKSDEGQTAMQRVYNRRLWIEQKQARSEGRRAAVSEGMRAAAANLMNDHPELKGLNRGFYGMLTEIKDKNDAGKVFGHGDFEEKTYYDADGDPVFELDAKGKPTMPVIGNDYFDSRGGVKYDANSIANAGESALQRLASGVGSMKPNEAEAIYRSATEAITSRSIQVKPENEKYLNDIRKEAYNKMRADFTTKNAKNFYDKQGREYIFDAAANDYVRQDPGGIKRFKKDGAGNIKSATDSETIPINRLMNAEDKFRKDFGRYQDLHAPLHVRH